MVLWNWRCLTIATIPRLFLKIAVLYSTGISLLLLTGILMRPDIVLLERGVRRAEKKKDKLTLDIAYEIAAMWDVNATIILPIVVTVNCLIEKSLDQHLKRLSLSC